MQTQLTILRCSSLSFLWFQLLQVVEEANLGQYLTVFDIFELGHEFHLSFTSVNIQYDIANSFRPAASTSHLPVLCLASDLTSNENQCTLLELGVETPVLRGR